MLRGRFADAQQRDQVPFARAPSQRDQSSASAGIASASRATAISARRSIGLHSSAVRAATLIALIASIASGCGSGERAADPAADPRCPGSLDPKAAFLYVGETATFAGRVEDTFYDVADPRRRTFLGVGAAYPDPQRLQVIIPQEARSQFPGPPEELYRRRRICVTGTVQARDGTAFMLVSDPSAIVSDR